ncbi:class I SAM-dependent methyltransferase [Streptomyces sp. XM4193]|uniref:class I SAM-dependent methyltransferase n=1 Tax=Streptomyces sp. XM4193 TaxID=2929782 RepID=UPI001FF7B8C8|nr:class I SAM-dependent methyltransferase [Streptomyces sp. XM4193]MCK1796860.1 class I SAM-dependent methyltransferase [Streptomyces sp. XM4193]
MKITALEAARHRLAARPPHRPIASLLTRAAHLAGERSSPLFQLVVLHRLKGFLRHIVVSVIRREFPDGDLTPRTGMSEEIHHDLLELAENLGVVRLQQRAPRARLRPDYAAVVRSQDPAAHDTPAWRRDRADYRRIRELVDRGGVLEEDRGADTPPHLRRDDVHYLMVLCRYILELEEMSLYEQVKPSFESVFYSDLGELAYRLYTSGSYRKLCRRLRPASFLDIGCGEGRHLEPPAQLRPAPRVVGVELDPKVAESARRRLAGRVDAEIVSTDLFEWRTEERFDMILSSYMLFYLDRSRHVEFYSRVRELLAPGGTYVVGQYFPDFQEYQRALIDRCSPAPRIQRWASDTGNSLLLAEVLLNRTLVHFRSVVYWDAFRDDLAAAGLAVREVLPADSLYYSHYVLIGRADDER